MSRRMSVARRRDTKPEVELRRELHRRGLRYRVNYPVPGRRRRTIDIAFTRRRLAVFVDGCFWHGCPEHGTQPKASGDWWRQKIETNQARDRDTDEHLRGLGWRVLRVWEHQEPSEAADRVGCLVLDERSSSAARVSTEVVQDLKAARTPSKRPGTSSPPMTS